MKKRGMGMSLMLALGIGGFLQPANASPAPAFRPILQSIRNQLPEGMVMRLPASLYLYGGSGVKATAYAKLEPYQADRLRVSIYSQPDCQARFCQRGYIAVFKSGSEDSHLQNFRSVPRDVITLAKGVQGTYIYANNSGGVSSGPYHVVVWEQDGLTFIVSSILPDKQGVIEIAKSMAKEPPVLSRFR